MILWDQSGPTGESANNRRDRVTVYECKEKQTMRFCTTSNRLSLLDPCMIVHTTNSLLDRDKGSWACRACDSFSTTVSRSADYNTSATTNSDCALSASGTSQVFRSPHVNNDFHEQGMDSRPLRDEEATASAFKHTDNVARVTSRVREPTEKTWEKICFHCSAKLPAQSGQKGKRPR